jgi:hypothetical protein
MKVWTTFVGRSQCMLSGAHAKALLTSFLRSDLHMGSIQKGSHQACCATRSHNIFPSHPPWRISPKSSLLHQRAGLTDTATRLRSLHHSSPTQSSPLLALRLPSATLLHRMTTSHTQPCRIGSFGDVRSVEIQGAGASARRPKSPRLSLLERKCRRGEHSAAMSGPIEVLIIESP